jgi:glycogen operon protein
MLLALLAACPGSGAPPHASDPDAAAPDAPDAPIASAPPYGATIDGDAVVFRVRSTRATHMEVWIYAAATGDAAAHVALDRDAGGDTWSARVPLADLRAAGVDTIYYGYRAWGPNWTYDPAWSPGSDLGFVARVDADGNRMDPNKLLIDPYARELSHDPYGPAVPDGTIYRTDDANRDKDSGHDGPKSIALPPLALDTGAHPARALRDDVVYEVHLRGLTAGDGSITSCAGTYQAAAARAPALAALGVTAVELLPVQETPNDANDVDPTSDAGDNYWGYSTLAYFAPDRRYACDRSPGGPTRELAAMTKAFHDAGLKVWIDVVYNHTAEGGGGSLLSLRGLDDAAYYELDQAGTGFADQTGIGASTNATSPLLRDLAIDSLRYWHEALGVDGFRFDLAAVLGNGCARSCYQWAPDDPKGILMRAVTDLPARPAAGGDGVDLIAEPWGVVAGTYQVGHFPAGWAEWNDHFRDLVRQDQNQLGSAQVTMGWLSDRVGGSPDLYGARGPAASIDYLDAHDGMTLFDLYSCNTKSNNQPWPYGPSAGGDDNNESWDHGGDAAAQRQAARTGMALVLLSAGVPMIEGGDEMLRSQRCNNNPYNLDSPAIWLDPADATRNASFVAFTKELLRFRAMHAALRPRGWLDGSSVRWFQPDGSAAAGAFLDDAGQQALGWRLDGGALGDVARAIFVAYDGGTGGVTFTLPAPAPDTHWYRVADTGAWAEAWGNIAAPGAEYMMNGTKYDLGARSLAVFVDR